MIRKRQINKYKLWRARSKNRRKTEHVKTTTKSVARRSKPRRPVPGALAATWRINYIYTELLPVYYDNFVTTSVIRAGFATWVGGEFEPQDRWLTPHRKLKNKLMGGVVNEPITATLNCCHSHWNEATCSWLTCQCHSCSARITLGEKYAYGTTMASGRIEISSSFTPQQLNSFFPILKQYRRLRDQGLIARCTAVLLWPLQCLQFCLVIHRWSTF